MHTKNQQVLIYLIKNYGNPSVTSLMKLCYLIDLLSIQREKPQITDFEYRRYNFGPFENRIYDELNGLVSDKTVLQEFDYTPKGDEFVTYVLKEDEFNFDEIAPDEKSTIDEVLESLKGYGAKILTEIAYKTKPMKAIGATLGGQEHFNEKLDLQAK